MSKRIITREQIIKLRKDLGLSPERFGRLFDVSRQTVINWEREPRLNKKGRMVESANPHHTFAKKMLRMIKAQKDMEE